MTPVLEQLGINQLLLELRRQHLEAGSDLLLPDREVKATRSELLDQSADRLWRKTEDLADLPQGESRLCEVGGGAEVDGDDQALLLWRQNGTNLLHLCDDGGLDVLLWPLLWQHLGDVVDQRVYLISSLLH